jgi:hypothetical protein
MLPRKQTRSLHGKRKVQSSDLARHYRGIGIKAVAAASRNPPDRIGGATTVSESKDEPEKHTKGESDER